MELPTKFESGRLGSIAAALIAAGLPFAAHRLLPGSALVDWSSVIGLVAGAGLAWKSWGGIASIAGGVEGYARDGGPTPPPPGRFSGCEAAAISATMVRLISRIQQQAGDANKKARADAYIGKTLALLDALEDPVFWIGQKASGDLIITYANTAAGALGIQVESSPPRWLGDPFHSGRVEARFGEDREAFHFEFVKREVTESRRKDDPQKWDGRPVNGTPGRARVEDAVVAVLGRDITERKRMEERERVKGMTDNLTGILNRAGYEEKKKEVSGTGQPYALVYIDLDKFKPVNDTHGHPAGDALLIAVAKLLRTFRGIPFRLGGDEFAMIIPGANKADTEMVAKDIVTGCNVPFNIHPAGGEPITVQIGASVGCACYPLHANGMEGLLKAADEAMYEAKRGGRNQYAFPKA
ncbi:diguanylate cyclase [Dechloromonas sp. ARDL1]|uniref:GGDEF domain-containing protein n=1 Tax=Dechloromonas sp. ARDL1 TaxID=3322121 RepID=UPI003DA718B8